MMAMRFPESQLRRGLCDCAICREMRDWWRQSLWMTMLAIALHHEASRDGSENGEGR